jgi:AraC-like DNA-binding protein
MQLTDFDDRISLDGAPCESRMLIVLPPECHFTFVCSGSVKWFSWSIAEDEDIATRIVPRPATARSLKTQKFMIPLPEETASRFRRAADETLGGGLASTAAETHVEDMLREQLEEAWGRNTAVELPSDFTRPAEQIVFRALQFAQSRPGQSVEIGDLARAGEIGYRTMLRAFERYLKLSPKRYLKLRQINDVYHAIRRNREQALADILSGCGVNEFGRFAGEYRSVFGELPSSTYQRYRPPAAPSGQLVRM